MTDMPVNKLLHIWMQIFSPKKSYERNCPLAATQVMRMN